MSVGTIVQTIKSGHFLVSDGAWGTFLQQKGMKPGECPELWCTTHRNSVLDIAKGYIDAGSDMVQSNSFGGSSFKLSHYNVENQTSDINREAASISREAAGENKFVIASIGPTGKMTAMGDVSKDDLYHAFKEQAIALEKGGADAVCIETMSALDEAEAAVLATKENTNLEIITTFSFEKTLQGEYRTMMGVSPSEMTKVMVGAGADIVGTNCGNGMQRMIEIVKEIRDTNGSIPILVHANAGLPVNIDGVDTFVDTPEDMAKLVPAIIDAGANILGGCCGTTPEHITAIKKAAQAYHKK